MMVLVAMAHAQHALFEPVRTDLGGGARIDWTASRLEVEASARRTGSEGTRALEELARRQVDLRIGVAALAIPIGPGRTLGALQGNPLWPSIRPRIGRWIETTNRYYSSGRVAVMGALSLVELLKPITMASATARQSEPAPHSGAVLDARGLAVEPCFAPMIRDEQGVIYDGRMWLDAAVQRPPATWVSDAADPVAARSGTSPLLAVATGAAGCVLTVDAAHGAPLRKLAEAGVLHEGTLVIVVDP